MTYWSGLRKLIYGIGETAVKASSALWEILPERLKPLVGMLVLGVWHRLCSAP